MFTSNLSKACNIHYPIIQAPMAGGITTPELVSAVSNYGGLGSLAGGYLTPTLFQHSIQAVRKLTNKPFMVNLFVPELPEVSSVAIKNAFNALSPFYTRLGVTRQLPDIDLRSNVTSFQQQIDIVLEEKVKICSFTFGVPSLAIIRRLKQGGVFMIGTATTPQEAILLEKKGFDAVVVQGFEAGGHQGGFTKNSSPIGLFSLLPQVVERLNIPVIAAGGIMNRKGIDAAFILGASAVQMGTAFLLTTESGAQDLHKKALLSANVEDMKLTRAYTGRMARGISNEFMKTMEKQKATIAPYPVQNILTESMRKIAAQKGDSEYLSMWGGQGAQLGKIQSVNELMDQLTLGEAPLQEQK